MKIVLIRHGTVQTNLGKPDELTDSGKRFAGNLVSILRDSGLQPELVFFDESEKSGQVIRRCRETVRGYAAESVRIEGYQYNALDPVFSECKSVDTAIICYTSESIRFFPVVQGSIIEGFTGDPSLKKPGKSVTDKLYERMIVAEFNGESMTQICTIDTGDSRH
jgi:hypothetical protein